MNRRGWAGTRLIDRDMDYFTLASRLTVKYNRVNMSNTVVRVIWSLTEMVILSVTGAITRNAEVRDQAGENRLYESGVCGKAHELRFSR